jgi:hypothetical protein
MPQYNFVTRAYGPSAKNSTLTWEDLDNSLLFLSESINEVLLYPLSGSNYSFVEANGTPAQNGLSLSASYALAKTYNPTGSNRFSLLVAPGYYEITSSFLLNTQYIDVVSVTGERDVIITGSGVFSITANDVYVRGIDVGSSNFTIGDNLNLLKVKNCKGGDYSFGGSANTASITTVAGTFIECEGGDYSFGGNGNAYGTFIDCVGGDNSFGLYCNGTFTNCVGGNWSFASQGNIEGGEFENCTAGEYSFASIGDIDAGASLTKCISGLSSFASSVSSNIYGKLYNCIITSGSFNTATVQPPGKIFSGVESETNTVITFP